MLVVGETADGDCDRLPHRLCCVRYRGRSSGGSAWCLCRVPACAGHWQPGCAGATRTAVLRAARARRHVRRIYRAARYDGARFGVLFWHKDGFSTACGHGTIALGAWAVDTGLVQAPQTAVPTSSSTFPPAGSRPGFTGTAAARWPLILSTCPVTCSPGAVGHAGDLRDHRRAPSTSTVLEHRADERAADDRVVPQHRARRQRPSAARTASRAQVPEPHGERSTSPSAKTVTLRWCTCPSASPRSSNQIVP